MISASLSSMPVTKCKLRHREIISPASLHSLTELVAAKNFPSILGGNLAQTQANRFSVWCFEPKEIFQFNASGNDPFNKLQQAMNKYKLQAFDTMLPKGMFSCGWIGFFGYELGRYIEKMPQTTTDDLKLPLIRLCFYDRAICYDHNEKTWQLIALEMEGETESAGDKIESLADLLNAAENTDPGIVPKGDMQKVDISKFNCNMTQSYYFDALEKTKRYIYDGEVYQINFSQRFECDFSARPIELFHWQNQYNPSPYAAYIGSEDFTIVSASPEMFLTLQDGILSTRPIKGTRPRVSCLSNAERINKANFAELVESEKDQAELNMIIDLERNDLTRVCQYGTIKVTQPRTIEPYPTVFHAVATIQGLLKDAQSPRALCDVLKATFPGGSITGAPKIRAMEIIDELEPTERSVYTGSIGFVGIDGNVCLNIAIRTVIIKGGRAFAQTGGGIVADSDPQAEWDETITKARALLAGLEAVNKNL